MNNLLLTRFVGRIFPCVEQHEQGGYYPIYKPVTLKLLQKHLDGDLTIGTYVLDADSKTAFGVIDIDIGVGGASRSFAEYIYTLFPERERVLEFSGRKGYHIWVFFDKRLPGKYIKEYLKTRLRLYGLSNVEVFPKQASLKGLRFGNLVKLPCGIHQVSKKRSVILKWESPSLIGKTANTNNE